MFSFWNAPEHWVYFKAFMCDDSSSNRFGLRIVGYILPNHSTDLTSRYIQVGECKSRKLKAGKLTIQLRSGLFEADESVGEYPGILSKTVEFEGVDFDVDFACIFKCKYSPKLFGKVEIKPAGCKDHGISFNLMKGSGGNINKLSHDTNGLMDLLKSHNPDEKIWKELALSLNYSRPEVDAKFSLYSEPVEEILTDYVKKGGKMNEFFKAMIKVANIFKIHPLGELNKKMDDSICKDIPESCLSEERIGSKRKYEYCNQSFTESKLDDIAGAITNSWKTVGRKLKLSELDLREIDLNYCNCGEKEKAFQMLITWRERDPDNCVPDKLFSILKESGLKHTALKLSQ